MTIGRRLLFSLVTLVLVFGVVEALCWAAWLALEARAMQVRTEKATENLKANAINFLVQTDPLLGFVLKPNNAASGTNSAGFVQFDEVPIARTAGRQRIATFGESTTQGHGPGRANYPHHLKHLLEDPVVGGRPVDVINAGVAGWNSDQVALWAQHKVARYQPDVAVFYTGWNDFQSYDPFGPPPVQSYFEMAYGNPFRIQSDFPIKTVVFAVAAYEATLRSAPKVGLTGSREDAGKYGAPVGETYRHLFASLDSAIASLRHANPSLTVVVSTLVGRWPEGTREDFDAANGHVWWMKNRSLSAADAEKSLRRFNEAIREYARARQLVLVDAEAAFGPLDRRKLQWDFAHMTEEGYELLANVIHAELVRQKVVPGVVSPRLAELLSKYAKSRPNVKQE